MNYYQDRPIDLNAVLNFDAFLRYAEKVALLSLVMGLQPKRILEIGTAKGGAARVLVYGLDWLCNDGVLVCVDPEPSWPEEVKYSIQHRAKLVIGYSPAALREAHQMAGGDFNLVFVDGEHTLQAVLDDAHGVLPLCEKGAWIVFHDALYHPVWTAIKSLIGKPRLRNVGWLSTHSIYHVEDGEEQTRGGLYCLEVVE
ncbi:MAG: class I SAM-dependent methyltransferase [Anaerolineae bacterium]|nr:class I SAM-dependent methyltransferase [Anaerolineae bacterium]